MGYDEKNFFGSASGLCFFLLVVGVGLPVNIIFLEVALDHEDDACLGNTDGAVNIVLWMKVRCWVNIGMIAVLGGGFLIGAILACCSVEAGGTLYTITGVLILPPLIFQIVWTIWGMCVLYYSPGCHMHEPNLFAWFEALLMLAV